MTSSNSETELLTEHFGYPPVSLIDDIINSVNILAERALNSVEQGLLNAPPSALGFKKKPPKPAPKTKSSRSRSKQQQQQQAADAEDEDGDDAAAAMDPADAARIEVESGTHQLETLLCASIDRNFDKFEIYVLRNILCVRPPDVRDWIRLSHYDGLDFSPAALAAAANGAGSGTAENGNGDGDVEMEGGGREPNGTAQHHHPANPDIPTLESINKLRRRLRESMRLNALLTAEHARNERLLADLRHLVGAPASSSAIKREKGESSGDKDAPPIDAAGKDADKEKKKKSPFAFLHEKGDLTEAGPDAPLSTNTAFTLSQMQALRALSTSLRTMTPDLVVPSAPESPHAPEEGEGEGEGEGEDAQQEEDGSRRGKKKKTWRRERLEYVEAATRRHLETVQGLELGRDGGVRDGEWQGPGRVLARGEVEGLERLASLLGGGDGDAGAGAGAGAGGEDEDGDGDGAGEGGADADRMDES